MINSQVVSENAASDGRFAGHKCSAVKWRVKVSKLRMTVTFLRPAKFHLVAYMNSFRRQKESACFFSEPYDGTANVFCSVVR